jgi:hypothetical protein
VPLGAVKIIEASWNRPFLNAKEPFGNGELQRAEVDAAAGVGDDFQRVVASKLTEESSATCAFHQQLYL